MNHSVVKRVLTARGQGFYYIEDVQALQRLSVLEKDRWARSGITPGYRKLREIGEVLAIGLELSDGYVAWGDAVSVSYGGKSGREAVFRFETGEKEFRAELAEKLVGINLNDPFRETAPIVDKAAVHVAIKYGVTQALLSATAWARRKMECQVIAEEWNLPVIAEPVPLQGSCGNDRYDNADKMIVNRLEVLPHTQVDDIEHQLGRDGGVLLKYAEWLKERILELSGPDYRPTIHFDVHGSIAEIFDHDVERVVDYLEKLESTVAPLPLRIESIAIMPTLVEQMGWHKDLRNAIQSRGLNVAIYMDEWANQATDIEMVSLADVVDGIHFKLPDIGGLHRVIDTFQVCRKQGTKILLGGSCIETETAARLSVHLGMALRPDALLVKPGMGINEGIAICRNEMNRILARLS